jgi:hypothetical protein
MSRGGTVKQVTIVADDKVGLLADISYILGKAKVNIESINADVVGGKAIVSLALSDDQRGKSVLEASGYRVGEFNSVVLKLSDKPGELNKITTMLSKEGVNIENVHMLSKEGTTTVLSVIVDKPRRAVSLLRNYVLNSEDVY